MSQAYLRIGDLLIAKGIINETQLARAVDAHTRQNIRIGQAIVGLGFAKELDIARCLGEQYDVPVVDPSKLRPTPEALAAVPREIATEQIFLPVALTEDTLYAVMSDPIDLELTDGISKKLGRRLSWAIACPTELSRGISYWYGLFGASGRKGVHSGQANSDHPDRRDLFGT